MTRWRHWTPAEEALLRERFATTPTPELAALLNRTQNAVRERARRLGLERDYAAAPAAARTQGRSTATGRFEAGCTPWNKGAIYRAGGRSAETRFKPGAAPHNAAPIGAERVSKDGILQRKVSDTGYPPRDWTSVHALLWVEHHGPIPKGHIVVFRNGNRSDIRIENLELITRVENMRRNTVHNLPKPLAEAIQLRGAIRRQINRRTRHGA
ncbi:MAG: HNH endonuclease signature motif containing protein [Piscinibacter sp.]|uniref:HNH endonuclease signature motif containing protein n=1 Tax=Piscinibacter sp. TaxID=1903157 RepID=UPI003D0CDE31